MSVNKFLNAYKNVPPAPKPAVQPETPAPVTQARVEPQLDASPAPVVEAVPVSAHVAEAVVEPVEQAAPEPAPVATVEAEPVSTVLHRPVERQAMTIGFDPNPAVSRTSEVMGSTVGDSLSHLRTWMLWSVPCALIFAGGIGYHFYDEHRQEEARIAVVEKNKKVQEEAYKARAAKEAVEAKEKARQAEQELAALKAQQTAPAAPAPVVLGPAPAAVSEAPMLPPPPPPVTAAAPKPQPSIQMPKATVVAPKRTKPVEVNKPDEWDERTKAVEQFLREQAKR